MSAIRSDRHVTAPLLLRVEGETVLDVAEIQSRILAIEIAALMCPDEQSYDNDDVAVRL
jgi:hypothetical protein